MSSSSSSSDTDVVRSIKSHVGKGKGISNVLIDRLCKKMCSDDFRGVFSANKIPRRLAGVGHFTIIVNLGEVDGSANKLPVGHFVCIAARPERISFIDPYGLPCIQPKVLTFLSEARRPIVENSRKIQHVDSPYCGLYSILFAVYFDKRADEWLKLNFSKKNLLDNDKKCVQYLKLLNHC